MEPQEINPYDHWKYDAAEMLAVDTRELYVRALQYYELQIIVDNSINALELLLDSDTKKDLDYFYTIYNVTDKRISNIYRELEDAYAKYDMTPPLTYKEFVEYLDHMPQGKW